MILIKKLFNINFNFKDINEDFKSQQLKSKPGYYESGLFKGLPVRTGGRIPNLRNYKLLN